MPRGQTLGALMLAVVVAHLLHAGLLAEVFRSAPCAIGPPEDSETLPEQQLLCAGIFQRGGSLQSVPIDLAGSTADGPCWDSYEPPLLKRGATSDGACSPECRDGADAGCNAMITSVRRVWHAVRRACLAHHRVGVEAGPPPSGGETLPVLVVSCVGEVLELPAMLRSVNVPVRLFVLVLNSDDAALDYFARHLLALPYGVVVVKNSDNYGFAASVNHGLRLAMVHLGTTEGIHSPLGVELLAMAARPRPHSRPLERTETYRCVPPGVPADYVFIVNSDVTLPPESLPRITAALSRLQQLPPRERRGPDGFLARSALDEYGLIFGPAPNTFYGFLLTRAAVTLGGFFDENFFPAYCEDVDLRWRLQLLGLKELVLGVPIHHEGGNWGLRNLPWRFMNQIERGRCMYYMKAKWGALSQGDLERCTVPPSGYQRPFNLSALSLRDWVVDPERIACIRTGHGVRYLGSEVCWYRGGVLLHKLVPNGTTLPRFLRVPTRRPHRPV